MEERFGHDFSRVRVHVGGAAEQSTRDLNASAYTMGHTMVFGAGRFTPRTHEGRRLIAHEPTHVVQQSDHAAFPAATGKPSPLQAVSAGTVQRSVGGSLFGTLIGAALGTVAGAMLFGPLGAVLGGIIGGVVGLIAGASGSADSRKLTNEERTEAERVYGPSLDYDRVRIAISRVMTFPSHARTPRETIYLPPDTIPDPEDLSDDLIGGAYFLLMTRRN